MSRGKANKRYTPEFKKLVVETMMKEKLILLMSLPSLPKQCRIVSAHSETSRCFYYLMRWEMREI